MIEPEDPPNPKPAAVCAVCDKAIDRAADATFTEEGKIVHKACVGAASTAR
jgi:hypothetical protein